MASRNRPSIGTVVLGMLAVAAMVAALIYSSPGAVAGKARAIPPPSPSLLAAVADARGAAESETAVFAGGCFWGVQAVFQHTRGVLNAVSGYAGGERADANYDSVSSGRTHHAEVVQITFDPRQVSYGQLLQIFFSVAHDPTQLNRQHPDVGTQYRSAVFYTNQAQKQTADGYLAELEKAAVFPRRLVTEVSQLDAFYRAETDHQNYATLHPDSSYIVAFDRPKLAQLKALMPTFYRETPVLVPPESPRQEAGSVITGQVNTARGVPRPLPAVSSLRRTSPLKRAAT